MVATEVGRGRSVVGAARARLGGGRAGLVAVTALALGMNTWHLSRNGLGNTYYSAAMRAMTHSWHDFFFVSFDRGGFISIDKPPVSLWLEAVGVRLLGFNSWGLLLPSALAGAGSVALLWCALRPRFGALAATTAGLVLALSPVNVAVNRLNLPDPYLILFLVGTAWAVLRSLDAPRWGMGWVVAGGVLVGVAFNVKMLAAYLPGPALALAVLVGTAGGWGRRVVRTAAFGLVALGSSLPWLLVVDAVSPGSRPYVGGSTNNTVWNLVFGYNGLGRVDGGSQGGFGARGAGAFSTAGGIIAGSPGRWRLLGAALAPQIAWLLPIAVAGALATMWFIRTDRQRVGSVVLWAGWLGVTAVVFSRAKGTFHAYYTSLLGPAVAALVGIGVAAAARLVRRNPTWWVVVAAVVAFTLGLQTVISARAPEFYGWTTAVTWSLVAVGLAALLALAVVGGRLQRAAGRLASVAVGFALLLAPAAWSVSETWNAPLNSTLPQAGPRTGQAGATFGSAAFHGDAGLAAYLRQHAGNATWEVAVANAQTASGLSATDGVAVMALGGFMGTDQAMTVTRFADLVAGGKVRYVLVDTAALDTARGGSVTDARFGGGPAGGFRARGGFGRGGFAASQAVVAAARASCVAVHPDGSAAGLPVAFDGSLYDCAGRADALKSSGG